MEAKVDVRKLQVLNDRINQTIDALNQVRLSVHGLGHTGMQPSMNPLPYFTQGFGPQQPFGFGGQGLQSVGQGFGGVPFGGLPGIGQLGQQGIPGLTQGYGFQHSPFTPYINPLANPYLTPWNVSGQTTGSPWGGYGGAGIGMGVGGIGGGLFHSGPEVIERQLAEVRAADPFRITQTFPFFVS